PYTFTVNDFPFTDPDSDGETLQSVTVTSLPGSGSLTLNSLAVSVGQTVPVAQLGKLVFTPVPGGSGSPYTAFQFTVSDGSVSSGTATETINVTPIAPTTTHTLHAALPISPYTFTVNDFPFTDPDSDGETLQSVTVTSLPGSGTLKLSGVNVTAGQVIAVGQIPNWTFTPAAHGTGTTYTNFQFTVSDGTASTSAATETVVVTPISPTTANHTVTTVEVPSSTFLRSDFPFTDPDADGETLQSVTVSTLPGAGTLKLSGVNVTTGQVIAVG